MKTTSFREVIFFLVGILLTILVMNKPIMHHLYMLIFGVSCIGILCTILWLFIRLAKSISSRLRAKEPEATLPDTMQKAEQYRTAHQHMAKECMNEERRLAKDATGVLAPCEQTTLAAEKAKTALRAVERLHSVMANRFRAMKEAILDQENERGLMFSATGEAIGAWHKEASSFDLSMERINQVLKPLMDVHSTKALTAADIMEVLDEMKVSSLFHHTQAIISGGQCAALMVPAEEEILLEEVAMMARSMHSLECLQEGTLHLKEVLEELNIHWRDDLI